MDNLDSKTATYCRLDLSLCLSEDTDSAIPAAHSFGIFSCLNQLIHWHNLHGRLGVNN